MSYDNWKAREPDPFADDPPRDQSDEPDEEPGRLAKGAVYDLAKIRLRGWWTPLGFKHSMDGYVAAEYFESGRFLGADSFGVEPLFESL